MAKIIAKKSTKNLFVFLFILNLKIKIIDKLGFIKSFIYKKAIENCLYLYPNDLKNVTWLMKVKLDLNLSLHLSRVNFRSKSEIKPSVAY